MTVQMREQCELLAEVGAPDRPADFLRKCMCVLHGVCAAGQTTTAPLASTVPSLPQAAGQLGVAASNATESADDDDDDDDRPEDNLINSDVFIYVIVFIVIVYFLTFLYLCMKKRQREAEDIEAGLGRQRGARSADQDRPPAYDEVVHDGAQGGDKAAEPPSYAEVLARSQQLGKPDQPADS